MKKEYSSFQEFWPFYLSQHNHPVCRVFHYLGTSVGIALCSYFIYSGSYWFIPLSFVPGYGFAWTGHFGFEKNKPAAFDYPFYSFAADFVMLFFFFTGRISSELKRAAIQDTMTE